MPEASITFLSRLFSLISFSAAGPDFLTNSGEVSSDFGGISSFFGTSALDELIAESSNSPIGSALKTISPSAFRILTKVPSSGATTSKTTLSVSISAIISSCLTKSPSFFNQLATVPSATDSGKVGAFISIVIILF